MRNPLTVLRRRLSKHRELRADGGTASQAGSILDRDSVRSAPFWLPPFLLVGLFIYGAIIWNIVLSLTNFQGLGSPDYTALDFENYVIAFFGGTPSWSELTVSPIWNSAWNTVVLMVSFSVVCLALGLVLAILVDQEIRFENTFRTIYLLPMSLSFVVTAKFWLYMYNVETGLVNLLLGSVGVGPVEIVQNPDLKLAAVAFALIWQFSGYAMIVYLAGLRAIPTSHFEAARVDGASTLRMYWRVIIPQLRTATVSALVVLTVFSLKAFDFLFSMYGGYQPGPSADILATRMVREAYANGNWAYGSAIAVILFLMALAIVTPYIYSQYKRGEL
ncbi:carbohydrate ABC transporter permease [Halonotius roseus]|jgi:glucose/mannose transport system permease protein|uniref:Sugar ABC transporter permease n=1 Tax=Halonotius roseus TaxID=2511997 RepID=A0A544QKU4_9EURY|nr:sugar ABC transporter permease [Halonotius roseus]TQQ78938.1 sugar ABC transporter permease [Halonotius roseus]